MDIENIKLIRLLPNALELMFFIYMLFKAIDFILGLLKTWKNKNYKSSKMRLGIIRFIAELIGVVFVIALDIVFGFSNFYLSNIVINLFVFKEAGSILENLAECGVNLPHIIADKLEVLNIEEKEKDKNE